MIERWCYGIEFDNDTHVLEINLDELADYADEQTTVSHYSAMALHLVVLAFIHFEGCIPCTTAQQLRVNENN